MYHSNKHRHTHIPYYLVYIAEGLFVVRTLRHLHEELHKAFLCYLVYEFLRVAQCFRNWIHHVVQLFFRTIVNFLSQTDDEFSQLHGSKRWAYMLMLRLSTGRVQPVPLPVPWTISLSRFRPESQGKPSFPDSSRTWAKSFYPWFPRVPAGTIGWGKIQNLPIGITAALKKNKANEIQCYQSVNLLYLIGASAVKCIYKFLCVCMHVCICV